VTKPLNPFENLYIIGTGGFAREVLCLIADIHPNEDLNSWVQFATTNTNDIGQTKMGINVIHEDDIKKASQIAIAVGDPLLRFKIANKFKDDCSFPNLIHPRANLSKWVDLSEGGIFTSGCVLTCNIKVGGHAHFNLNSTVGHDSNIGSFFTAAPGVNISGDCNFGDFVNLGTNASVKQGVSITDNVIVGMGCTVVKNIEEAGVYIGVPAKRIK
jgi:sugar O-acyltransferase (sialic acid O-acetyltransferase NeuD family)